MAGNSDQHKQKSDKNQRRPEAASLICASTDVYCLLSLLVGIDLCQWHVVRWVCIISYCITMHNFCLCKSHMNMIVTSLP